MLRKDILGLYKNLLRYGQTLKLTDREYFRSRVHKNFYVNKSLTNPEDIKFQFEKGVKLLVLKNVV